MPFGPQEASFNKDGHISCDRCAGINCITDVNPERFRLFPSFPPRARHSANQTSRTDLANPTPAEPVRERRGKGSRDMGVAQASRPAPQHLPKLPSHCSTVVSVRFQVFFLLLDTDTRHFPSRLPGWTPHSSWSHPNPGPGPLAPWHPVFLFLSSLSSSLPVCVHGVRQVVVRALRVSSATFVAVVVQSCCLFFLSCDDALFRHCS
jgi:hypothetical protein